MRQHMGNRVLLANKSVIAPLPAPSHSRGQSSYGLAFVRPEGSANRKLAKQSHMQPIRFKALPANSTGFLRLVLTIAMFLSCGLHAQNVQHLTVTQPGGMPGTPFVTGVTVGTNSVTVTWDGPSGYYQLYENLNLAHPNWQPIGARTNLSRRAVLLGTPSNALFRVSGPAPHYVGWQNCIECHQAVYDTVSKTPHAQALAALTPFNQNTNPACWSCHTVGYGVATGFTSSGKTPLLAGVQCENCHGVAGNHAANPDDPTVRPRVELAATVCGGCHTPTYNQWQTSGHAGVVEDLNATNVIDSCGRCHSGSVREALLEGQPLPVGDANVPIGCATCHDSHEAGPNPAQLLNPIFSTNNYFITTSVSFASQYNPNINLCAQCHNHRGAAWTSTSRAPHHSPQYNFLLGSIGELASGSSQFEPAAHALLITNQCVGCHMQKGQAQDQYHPALQEHTFSVDNYTLCLQCHPSPQQLVAFTTGAISNQVQEIKAALDLWATTKAPDVLRTNYGARAWEYTIPGDLSPGGSGPNTAQQALIPDSIKKARFNLYLVLYDGSYGVHNGPYAVTLLNTAQAWVEGQLDN